MNMNTRILSFAVFSFMFNFNLRKNKPASIVFDLYYLNVNNFFLISGLAFFKKKSRLVVCILMFFSTELLFKMEL